MDPFMRPLLLLIFAVSLLGGYSARAENVENPDPTSLNESAAIDIPQNKLLNFGVVYAAQWGFYFVSQHETIESHGSFNNWIEHSLHPEFDKDTFDYNLFKHALSGGYYYLFYRSRGYTEQASFIWSALSSLAFEFTIETITEKPSIQDIYQTPLFGAIVGVGFENLSKHLHELDTWYGHTLGYILNPFTLLPPNFAAVATYTNETPGVLVTWVF